MQKFKQGLRRHKREIIRSVLIIPIVGLLVGFPSFGKAITWIPSQAKEDVQIGTVKIVNAKFTSKENLQNVEFWITPRLSKYVTIEPKSISEVAKGEEYNVSLLISVPPDFKTKKYSQDNLKQFLKDRLGEDFNDEDYKDFKNEEEFLNDFSQKIIRGLVFVKSERTSSWPQKWFKDKIRKIKVVNPLPLKIVINVKKATAQEIPKETTLPSSDRIATDPAVGQDYIKDEIIVKFKEGVSEEAIKQIVLNLGGVFIGFFEPLGVYQIQVNVAGFTELDQKINQLEQNINVEYAGRQILTLPTL